MQTDADVPGPVPTGRRKVTGPSAATQTWPKYAPSLRRGGRSAIAENVRSVLARARLAAAQQLRLPQHYFRAARCSLCRAALMKCLGFRERAQRRCVFSASTGINASRRQSAAALMAKPRVPRVVNGDAPRGAAVTLSPTYINRGACISPPPH
jgi:hypothetical protein